MREFFSSKKFKILLAVLAVLIGFMVYTSVNVGMGNAVSGVVGVIVSPFQKLSAVISNSVTGFFEKIILADKISEENAALKDEIRLMREQLVELEQYRAENQQYRQFLDIKQDNPDFVFESAMVIGRDPSDFFYSFTIDKGSADGISLYDPVITPDGLVGRISEVSISNSKVVTILNPGIDVGAFDTRTRDTGVIAGDLPLAEQGMCKMLYLPRGSSAAAGDIITTSGIGGVFPKGLIIGTIDDVQTEAHGISLYAKIKPTADIPMVQDVFVITSFKGQNNRETPEQSDTETK